VNTGMERPPGAPSRANSQRQRIPERLREAGSRGVLAAEFYDGPQCRFGRSRRNRVNELRAMRHKIVGEWETKVDFRYTLIERTLAPKALPTMAHRRNSTGTSERLATAGPGRRTRVLALCSTAKGAASR
jgi:hypothetical protein